MATISSPGADRLLETLRGTIIGLVRQEIRDLTERQLAVFLTCYQESEPQTVRGLAEKLNISKPATTRAFDRLEEDGLLRRRSDPLDRRSVLAARTTGGATLFRDLRKIMADAAKAAEQPE